MKKVICSVRDSAADVYASPFTSQNINTAMRDFAHACRDQQSQLSKNPEDFALYLLGEFEDDTGILIPVAPKLVANATQFNSEV